MLRNSVKQALLQVINIIEQIQFLPVSKKQHLYCELNIGNHIRHINDHFLAVKQGIKTGLIDYNSRNRGAEIETNAQVALTQLQDLVEWIDGCDFEAIERNIRVLSEINSLQTQSLEFHSSLAREFLYLINHTIHHTAHMGLIAKNQGIEIPLETGMAPCTMTFLRSNN